MSAYLLLPLDVSLRLKWAFEFSEVHFTAKILQNYQLYVIKSHNLFMFRGLAVLPVGGAGASVNLANLVSRI